MTLPNHQLSFAAGSTSLDPYGYRIIGDDAPRQMKQLARHFPTLRRFLNSSSLIVSAYPAALGLGGVTPFIDTYLHPATFIRSFRLATTELRPVIMVAQPLVGADLLLQLCQQNQQLPSRLLWAVGGYYFPVSLERFVAEFLSERGCKVTFLHSYGVAEIGHSCFAGVERFMSGVPRFQKIAEDVNRVPAAGSDQLILERKGKRVHTGDAARFVQGAWRIESSHKRLDPSVREIVESWTSDQWIRRTGYLKASENQVTFQLREGVDSKESRSEVHYHKFWHLHGGSRTTKPRWNLQRAPVGTEVRLGFQRSPVRL